MRSLFKTGLALLILALLLIGLSYSVLRAQGTARPAERENRAVVSERRQLEAGIRAVHLTGPIDMTLRQGAVPSLIIKGEQRLMGNIHAWKDAKGVLSIGPRGMLLHHRQPLQAILVLPELEAVVIRGSGESTVNGFSSERMAVELHGAGNVKFNGRVKQLAANLRGSGDIELNGGTSERVTLSVVGSGDATVVGSADLFELDQSGSGDVDAEHLACTDARIDLIGSGDAVVNARNKVEARLRGSGGVTVYGDPVERNVEATGTGEVQFR